MRTGTIHLLVATAAFFWGANFVLAGFVLVDLSPAWAAALRFSLAAAVMVAFARWKGVELLPLWRRHGFTYAVLGLVGIAGFNILFFTALRTTSADNGALIMATNPLVTTLLAGILIRERPTRRQLAALPLALAGVAVVISHGDPMRLLRLHLVAGDVEMLAANLAWACYNVLTRRFMPHESPLGGTALMMVSGAAVLLAAAIVNGVAPAMPGAIAMLALVVMAVAGTVLAYLFWGEGIRTLGAGRTALFLNLVPVSAMVIGDALGTAPTGAQWVGGLLVLAGVSVAMLPSRRAVPA